VIASTKASCLVTGGAGFIGSHVAKHCLAMGHRVTVLDDLSGGYPDQIPNGAAFVQGSITDERLLANLFATEPFDFVYHLAAYAAEGLSHFIRRFNYTNNLIGTVNLINLAVLHNVKCFVFTSSIAVYGRGQLPMHEDLIPLPEDPYGISKLAAELDLRAARQLFGLNYIIFRPHNVYGEHQNLGDPYRNVLGIFMNQILRHEPLTVFGDGSQTRAFTYIDDVAPYIARAAEMFSAYNQTINIGADRPSSVKHLVEVVTRAMGVAPRVRHLPARDEVVHAYADHAKARSLFGIERLTSLEDGVTRMASWARRVGSRSSRVFQSIELPRNMPPSWAELSDGIKR